jgi:hypothetical protein
MSTNSSPIGYKSDQIRVRQLITEADNRLQKMLPPKKVKKLVNSLKRAVNKVDFRHLNKGLCLFVGDQVEEVQHLSKEVEDRLLIGNTFALKDVLVQDQNDLEYCMLILCDERARLIINRNSALREMQTKEGFPLNRDDGPGSTEKMISSTLANNAWFPGRTKGPSGRAPLPGAYTAEKNSVQLEHLKQFYREVDQELRKLTCDQPPKIILCGARHQIALFEEVTSREDQIIARIVGNFTKHTETQLHEFAMQQVEVYMSDIVQAAAEELLADAHYDTVVFGIEEIWQLAQQKPIETLVIEADFQFPAVVNRNHLIIEPAADDDDDEMAFIDDVTEELACIAHNAGAKIFLCRKDVLKDYGRIAARFSF